MNGPNNIDQASLTKLMKSCESASSSNFWSVIRRVATFIALMMVAHVLIKHIFFGG